VGGDQLRAPIVEQRSPKPCKPTILSTASARRNSAASPSSTLMSLAYGFNQGSGDNGNVMSITNNLTTART
jgi:hypothetical protein